MNNVPYVRMVDAFYENRRFYILTHALSGKMEQININPVVSIVGEWFTASGKAINMGYFGRQENIQIANKKNVVFSEWINNGHNDFGDINTIILCVELTDGVLFLNGKRYEIHF